jgi:hypothetical protein
MGRENQTSAPFSADLMKISERKEILNKLFCLEYSRGIGKMALN